MSETRTPVEVAAEDLRSLYLRDQNDPISAWTEDAQTVFESVDVGGLAGVLQKHEPDVTSYDAGDIHGCAGCDWTVPIGADWDARWSDFYAHQGEALKCWLTNGTKEA